MPYDPELVERVAARVRQELESQIQQRLVPPLASVRGTWQDESALKHQVGEPDRIGTDGTLAEGLAGLAARIDHTLLRPDATRADVVRLTDEARAHGFHAVCVNPSWVTLSAERLRGSGVLVVAVVGFPLGAATAATKAAEAAEAVANGADEVDMVMNLGLLKSDEPEAVAADVRGVVRAAGGRPVKLILETHLLSREQVVAACAIAREAGARWVKTSSGFSGGGATEADVALIRAVVGPDMGVKAAGGITDAATAERLIAAGADRIGASASVAIVGAGARG